MKKFVFQRVFRINFIKTELNQLVSKSMFKNTYNSKNISTNNIIKKKLKDNKHFSLSFFRLYGMLDLSPKLVNKKYRLSRFSLNKLAKTAEIAGFVKRGW